MEGDPLVRVLAGVVLEDDLPVDPLVAVGTPPIDLSSLVGNREGVPDQDERKALVVDGNLALFGQFARLLLHGGRVELLFHRVAQRDGLAAGGTEDLARASWGESLVNRG